ncbi:MAG: sensor histidine kinase [Actinomycetota bacterium]
MRPTPLSVFQAGVALVSIVLLALLLVSMGGPWKLDLLLWTAVVAVVELVQVPFWKGVQVSIGFPILLAVGIIHSPAQAALVAFVGSVDPREFRREVTVLRALFNRSQVAMAVLAASSVFHALATARSGWESVLPVAILAGLCDYVVNVTLVSGAVAIAYEISYVESLRRMRIGRSVEFFVNYIGLGFFGAVLAKLYVDPLVGVWAIPAVLMPLVLARQMFFRTRALEQAHEALKVREQVMRGLSDRMAEERQDERAQIAAYLHDDLAQLLFRLSLQVDVAKRHLRSGETEQTEEDLESIRETKNRTSDLVRALIRDLHRSPLGRKGLGEALSSFLSDIAGGSGVQFDIHVVDLKLSPAIQLLIYHIAREAAMNALKHSGASSVSVSVRRQDEGVQLQVRDDGIGFDTSAPGPEGHFGLAMMSERAQVVGADFNMVSAPGEGTTVTVTFPDSWIQDEEAEDPVLDSQNESSLSPVAEPSPSPQSLSA